jgi:hypothetical protein
MASMETRAVQQWYSIFLLFVSHHLAQAVHHQDSDGTVRSSFACYGSMPSQRACLFSDVFYSIDNNTFHLVRADDVDPGLIQENIELGPEYSVTTSSYTPETSLTQRQPDLNVFWTFWHHGAAYSLGHAILHELFPIYVVMSNLLGEDLPIAFNLVSTSGSLPAVFDHISAATKGRVVNWPELRSKAQASGKSWIWFESAIMGHGGIPPVAYDLSGARHPSPSFFNNLRWLGFRKWMLRTVGVNPEHRPSTVSIVINDKDTMDTYYNGSADRRRILNIKALEQHLRGAFPNVQVCTSTPLQDVHCQPRCPSLQLSPLTQRHHLAAASTSYLHIGSQALFCGWPHQLVFGCQRVGGSAIQ